MKRFSIVIEKAAGNYGAFLPDVPGCIATAKTIEETKALIQEALAAHLELMAEDGDAMPEPTTIVDYVEVEVPESAKRKAS